MAFWSMAAACLERDRNTVQQLLQTLGSYPVKLIAAFIFAPLLMLKMVITAHHPARRLMAIAGLLLASGAVYFLSTWLGRATGFWLVYHAVGFWIGLGFLFGSFFSTVMTAILCTLVFNAVCFLFLKMSAADVIHYLNEISS